MLRVFTTIFILWRIFEQFVYSKLKLVNLKDLKNDKTLSIKSVFKPNENSWGFSPFITMDEITNKNNGFYDETKDRVILEACLSLDFPYEKN